MQTGNRRLYQLQGWTVSIKFHSMGAFRTGMLSLVLHDPSTATQAWVCKTSSSSDQTLKRFRPRCFER